MVLTSLACAGERLVQHFARIYNGEKNEDVLQAGRVGLLKAVHHFNPAKGASFATYASHCIKGEIRHYLRQEVLYYRPGTTQDMTFKVDSYREKVLKERGEFPPPEEIARFLKVKTSVVIQAIRSSLVSVEEIELTQIASLQDEYASLTDRLALQQALASLSRQQQEVLYLLFYRDLTQLQTGKILGISQRKVSAILSQTLQKLAKVL